MSIALSGFLFDSGVGLRAERREALARLPLPSRATLLVVAARRETADHEPDIADLLPGLHRRPDVARRVLAARVPLAVEDGAVDGAVLHGVLDSVDDPCGVLREASRALRRGGRISIYGAFTPPGFAVPLWRRVAGNGASYVMGALRDLDEILLHARVPLEVEWQKTGAPGIGMRMVQLRKVGGH